MAGAAALAPMAEQNSRRCGTWVGASLEHTPGREGSDSSRALRRRARPRVCLSALFPTSSILLLALGSSPAGWYQRAVPHSRPLRPSGGRGTGAHSHTPALVRSLLPAPPQQLARPQALTPLDVCHIRGSHSPRLTRTAQGAGEQAAGFPLRKGVYVRSEVPYLSPEGRTPTPASSPLGASCRGLGPSSRTPTFC